MDFYAEGIPDAPEIAYIAIVGFFEPDFSEEIIERVKRIKEASPTKNTLVLDVRGLTGLEAEHFDLLEHLDTQLQEIDWELVFCNIPDRFQDFFQSGRMQRTFSIFPRKADLLESLKEEDEPEVNDEEKTSVSRTVPVIFRTESGIRLFEGQASDIVNSTLIVWTTDRNAKNILSKQDLNPSLYFDTDRIQVIPKQIQFGGLEEVENEHWNYRVEVALDELDAVDQQLVKEYFEATPSH